MCNYGFCSLLLLFDSLSILFFPFSLFSARLTTGGLRQSGGDLSHLCYCEFGLTDRMVRLVRFQTSGRLAGADPGEVKWVNFHPPLSEPLFNHADAQTSNTSTRLWFYYIIAKIHPPFQILDPRLARYKDFSLYTTRP